MAKIFERVHIFTASVSSLSIQSSTYCTLVSAFTNQFGIASLMNFEISFITSSHMAFSIWHGDSLFLPLSSLVFLGNILSWFSSHISIYFPFSFLDFLSFEDHQVLGFPRVPSYSLHTSSLLFSSTLFSSYYFKYHLQTLPVESIISFLDIVKRSKLTFPNIHWPVEKAGRTFLQRV